MAEKTGPSIKRGHSRQDYETPADFMRAVADRFGAPILDLAASDENPKAPMWITEAQDSLSIAWHLQASGVLWLNPPFGVIGPWAKKCWEEKQEGCRILMLVPASVGSNWFKDFVHNRALVCFLSPRITFEGADDPYPKDLVLCCYNFGTAGYECWRWK